jgi:release factor glutamine methyltransferase
MLIKDCYKNYSLPPREIDWFLANLLNKPREFILAHPESSLSEKVRASLKKLAAKRRSGWPLAYLVGHQEFFGFDFLVNPATLIPRPETELLVENLTAMARRYNKRNNKLIIIDLGTGSGAIIITVAKKLLGAGSYKFYATDISPAALAVAKKNASRHGVNKNIIFRKGDLLQPIKNQLAGQPLLIAANLPYLTLEQIKKSPSIKREPRLALSGGRDGLKYYRRLFKQLKTLPYRSANLFLEIDPGQALIVSELVKKSWKNCSLEIIPDLAGRKRLIKLRIT